MANEDYQQEAEESAENPETAKPQADDQEQAATEALQARVEELSQALQTAQEDVLRAQAEVQNARRRAEQDVQKAHKFGQEKLVADLLPVVDNLERSLAAIDTEDEANKAVVEGIQLTLKSFIDTLNRHQVEAVDPQGEPFDPQLHQAMSMVPNPDVEPNTVLEVFQKGYTLHGRLVRPAMVVVAKAPE